VLATVVLLRVHDDDEGSGEREAPRGRDAGDDNTEPATVVQCLHSLPLRNALRLVDVANAHGRGVKQRLVGDTRGLQLRHYRLKTQHDIARR
jgi:hypothetical protein